MTNSKHIAKLLGPTLIVMNVSEAINSQMWATVPATQTYLAGSLWFLAGLSIIRAHNHWTLGWSVLITVMGWFIMLGGLSRMFFPEAVQQGAQNVSVVLALQMVLLTTGIVLTFKAYSRDNNKTSAH
ncbi:hypothetical protein [Flavobacterium sp. ZS1P14]|uniref:hypothetical protein n=1 Tax=Flavobacterium sp. ZS1P14 TaxID=3401729 RepID=UPI003AAB626D